MDSTLENLVNELIKFPIQGVARADVVLASEANPSTPRFYQHR